MPFGVSITNDSGDTIIDGTYSVMSVASTFSVGHTSLTDGVYWFAASGSLATSGDEILLLRPATSQWIACGVPNTTGTAVGFASNQATIAGAKLDRPANLTAPTGFGAAIYDDTGARVWSDNLPLGYVVDGVFVDVPYPSGYDPAYTETLVGNSFFVTGGGFRIWLGTGRLQGLSGERTATDQITLSYRYVQLPNAGAGSSGTASYASDIFAISGRLT